MTQLEPWPSGLRPDGKGWVPLVLERAPDPDMSFDEWQPFKTSAMALVLARRLVDRSASTPVVSPVLLCAPPGMGKTHLLHAVANADPRAKLIHFADWCVELERALRIGARAELRYWLTCADVLLLDDLDLCPADGRVQDELLALFDSFAGTGKAIVASTRAHVTDLGSLGEPLRSRLAGAVVCVLGMADLAERRALLLHFFGAEPVPGEVLDRLAGAPDSIRQLKAVARQTTLLHRCLGLPINLDLVRTLVERPAPRSQPSLADSDAAGTKDDEGSRERLKQMLAGAGNENEQALALEIALGERLRQLRDRRPHSPAIERLEKALELLREGRTAEALKCISL